MAKDQRTITIGVDIQPTLKNMDDVVSKLQKGLKEGSTQLDLSKGIGKSLQKQIENFQEQSRKFSQLTKDNQINLGDSKEAIKSGEKMIEIFKSLQSAIGDFNNLSVIDAKRLFPQAFNSQIDQARERLNSYAQDIQKLESAELNLNVRREELEASRNKLIELQGLLEERKTLNLSVDTAQKALEAANSEVDELRAKLRESISVKIKVAESDIAVLQDKATKAASARKEAGIDEKDFSGKGQTLAYKGHREETWRKAADSDEKTAALRAIEAYKQEMAIADQLIAKTKELSDLRKGLVNKDLARAAEGTGASSEELTAITDALEKQKQAADQAGIAQKKLAAHSKEHGDIAPRIENATKTIQKQEKEVTDLAAEYDKLGKEINTNELIEILKKLGVEKISGLDITPELLKSEEGVKKLLSTLSTMDKVKLDMLKASLKGIDLSADQAEDAIKVMQQALRETDESAESVKEADKEVERLANNLKDFFSISNSIQLFKRAVTSAMNTVKELDATMTEAAVVTDFSVGDMWNKLPTYADEAQKLGVSINGLYGATTLYYQQGLKTNEAMALGIETMKMARIAGMESSEATEAMTAALRGFNMELNETSATQVNDVYSKLAAVTAADTNQIATAMSKTASIAASANMEFETTAALLAQIIETTQEAPETAGTALKTIIARFSEVKSLQNKGESSGKDAEGEDIDVNKIQTALRSVGISMNDFFAGTEGLDSVLMKLAEKWDTLDFTTQRYIATTAAGSRQQSRFIAMMSDYARTTELVSAAQNSAGASQMQFNKTLDSMDAKLQQLENAWNEFLMGLANSEILKAGVDILTNLLSGINSIIDAMSFGAGPLKSIVSLLLTISTLKIGKGIFTGFTKSLEDTKALIRKNGNLSQAAIGNNSEVEGQKAGEKVGNGFFDKIIQVFRKRRPEVQAEIEQMLADETNKTTPPLTDDKTSKSDPSAGSKNLAGQDGKQPAENLEKSAGAATKAGKAFEYVNKNSTILATGFMSVAMACSALSQRFEETGNTDLAKVFSGVATGASYLGTALMVLPGIFQGLKIAADLASKGFVKLYASMGPIGLIIIGIVAAVLILVAVIASLKTESEILSARLETISERMNHFAEESQKAKEAVNELTQALEDIKTKDPFEGLIKGTKAWNEALIENNKQVLELINKYPELRQYITNEDGVLGITEEGLNTVIDRQSRDAENAFYAAETLAQEKIKTERTLALNKTSFMTDSEDRFRTMGISDVKYTELITELINQDIFNSKKVTDPEALIENVLSEAGIDDKDGIVVETIYKDLFDVPNASDEQKLARQTSWENLVQENRVWTNSQQSSNQAIIGGIVGSAAGGTENFEELNNAMGALYANSFGWNFEYELEDVLQDFDLNNKRKEWDEKYAALKGINVSDIDKLKKDEGLTDEDIVRTVMIEERRKNIESSTKEMNNLFKDNKELAKWFNYENLTKDDIARAQGDPDFLKEIWTENEKSLEAAGFTRSTFKQYIDSQIGMAANALSETDGTTITAREASLKKDKKGLYGKTDIDQIEVATEAAIKNLNEEQKKIFTTSMYDIDWSNADEIESFRKQMEDLGYNIPTDAFDKLIEEMKDVGNATKKMDLSKLKETTKITNKILSGLRSGDHKGVFTAEEYQAMIAMDPALAKAFIETDDGFVLVGMTMDSLATAIQENTKALNKNTIDELRAKSNVVDVIADARYNERGEELQGREFLRIFLEKASETDLQNLGIEGLRKDLKVDDLSSEIVEGLTRQLWQIMDEGTKQSYLQQAEELEGQTKISTATSGGVTASSIMSYGRTSSKQQEAADLITDRLVGGQVSSSSGSQNLQQTEGPLTAEDEKNNIILIAKEYGVAQDLIDNYINALERGTPAQKKAALWTLKAAIAQADANQKNEQGIEKLKALGNAYKGVTEDGAGYDEAVKGYADYFGVDEDFIKGNFGKIQEAAAGDIDALQEIYDLANQKYELTVDANGNFQPLMNVTAEAKKGIDNYITSLAGLGRLRMVEVEAQISGYFPGIGEDGKPGLQYINAGQTYTALVWDELEETSTKKGGGSSSKKWENPYDEFYNSIEKINEELRIREQLERRYQRLLDRNAATAAKLVQIQRNQLASLEAERKEREYVLKGRERQMKEILQKNSDIGQYATWNDKEMRIEIDWDLLEQLNGSTNEKLTTKVQDFISDLEEQQKLIEDELDAIESIEDATWEIYNSGKDEYLDLENQIKDAVINARQREIDELSEINNSINDANSAILDSMQKQIDQERQLRDNQKTEEEIANKENRLAYLRQDTSGANALEIMKLEKEINDQKQDYTDTLIDQKISELQEQNDLAAEQRQTQIDILQAQLDYDQKVGAFWDIVDKLLKDGVDAEGNLLLDSELAGLLKEDAGFDSLSNIKKMDWMNDTNELLAIAVSWLTGGGIIGLLGEGAEVEFTDANGNVKKGTVNKEGNVVTEDGMVYSGESMSYSNGKITSTETGETSEEPELEKTSSARGKLASLSPGQNSYVWREADTKTLQEGINDLIEDGELKDVAKLAINGLYSDKATREAIKKIQGLIGVTADGYWGPNTAKAFKNSRFNAYATGGLADFTGPAWLDGTKSRPEYVLSADQTKAFFSLVDVLSSLQSGSSKTAQNSGDNTYDIDINVESIGSDYDVERLADTVKRLINEDARYRNNNAINLMR